MYKIGTHPTLPGNDAVFATQKIMKNTVLFDASDYPTIKENNRFAITLKPQCEYIDLRGKDARLVNHSCDPNVEIQVDRRLFVAKRDIEVGEMLNFNYLTTEPYMVEPFNCVCGSPNCKGLIKGYN